VTGHVAQASPSIFVAMPAFSGVEPEAVESLLGLVHTLTTRRIGAFVRILGRRSVISTVRDNLAHEFLASAKTHLLFLDSDQGFSPQTVLRLIDFETKHRVGIVAAPAPCKQVAPKLNFSGLKSNEAGEIEVKGGFVRVDYAATGCMLISRQVFERLAPTVERALCNQDDSTPRSKYFGELIIDHPSGVRVSLGEDFAFCARWNALGGQVWCDGEARIYHYGTAAYVAPTILEQLQQAGGQVPA
jgi:hypothetical protein